MTSRSALLWMTHVWNDDLEAEFKKILHNKDPDFPEVWLILDSRTPDSADLRNRFQRCHIFNEEELFRCLHYTHHEGVILFDNMHFPVLDFYLSRPEYDYYWVIEFDVRYTGDWGRFLHAFSMYNHDLVTSHIRHFHEEPGWWWWDSLQHGSKTIDRGRYLRSFNVIYRISNRALAMVHDAQQDGWYGHPEELLPTLLYNNGFSLLDFGGDGEFVMPGGKNVFYTSGSTVNGILNPFCTMRWRPSRAKAGIWKNKLYHPVKPSAMMEPLSDRIRFFSRWIWKYICEKL